MAILILPGSFFLYGTWKQLLRLPIQIASVAPFVSANAHNLWWVVLYEHASVIPDFEPSPFSVPYSTVGALLVVMSVILVLARTQTADDPAWRSLPALAAFQSFAFFMLVTKAHENPAFLVLPLLSLVWVRSRALTAIFLVVSLTFLANLLLHDPVIGPLLAPGTVDGQNRIAQRLNAVVNVAALVGWAGIVALARSWDESKGRLHTKREAQGAGSPPEAETPEASGETDQG